MFKMLVLHFKGKSGVSTEAAGVISCWYIE